jgi:hypothetical protein
MKKKAKAKIETKYTAFRCPVDLLAQMKTKAKSQRRSMSNYLICLIDRDVSENR